MVEVILLAGNRLSGPIPPELGNLMNLVRLTLSNNQLSGPIPIKFANLASLSWLSLENNLLSGQIPRELRRLRELNQLYLAGNQFSGCIDPSLRLTEHNDLGNLGLGTCGLSEVANVLDCVNDVVVANADSNRGLVADCYALLTGLEQLLGDGYVNWSGNLPIDRWEGVTVSGTPRRVTKLELPTNRPVWFRSRPCLVN